MEVYADVFYITTIILLLLVFFKTYLFVKRTPGHGFWSWFLFNRYDIYNSHNQQSAKAKTRQNTLSLIVLILLILDLIFLMLSSQG